MNDRNHIRVAIVGGGVAGLCCARTLAEAGIPFTLFEGADGLGGRVRTDDVDGFRLDRGFQVLLTAYPEARRTLDYGALDLQRFYPGAVVRHAGRFHRLPDPFRHRRETMEALRSPIGSWADKLRVGRLRTRVRRGSDERLLKRPETTTLAALEAAGFSDEFVELFFRPFLGGIFLESGLTSSSRMLDYTFRMLASGDIAVPSRGMEAIPGQLARPLDPASIRVSTPVEHIEDSVLRLRSGEFIHADFVVVAADAAGAATLLRSVEPMAWRSVTCLYFAAHAPPVREPMLVLNGSGYGPVNNLAAMDQVSPAYAPVGRSLVSATVLGDPKETDDELEKDVRAQMEEWFGESVKEWELLRTYRIRHALPDQDPPALATVHQPVAIADWLFTCGDHRDMRSLQGAMVSGRRAGEAVAAKLTS